MCRRRWEWMTRMTVIVAGLQLGSVHGMERSAPPPLACPQAGLAATTPGQTRMLLDRLRRLPDLTAMARERGASDLYAELEKLKREHDATKTPYRYSMPYRNPPRPCKSGEHTVPSIKHSLVNPARKDSAELWEAELHEAEMHGAPLPAAVAAFLGNLPASDPKGGSRPPPSGSAREALVDRAMRQHGDFGVYGDVRAGLAAISKDNTVTLTDVEEGIRVDIVPNDGHGHEYQFVVTSAGKIENFMAGESMPRMAPLPEKLSFRFNAVQWVKNGEEMTLTIYPVWGDAQRAPPEGFEDNIRVYRLNEDEFLPFYEEMRTIDFVQYVKLTDADFKTTPPDMRHTEMLFYSVNGREVVNWGHPYARLEDAALRQPLLALAQQAHNWVGEHPLAELPQFQRIVLRDVQGLEGGRNVYVRADGAVDVQVVTPTETGLHERRYAFNLKAADLKVLLSLLEKHPLAKVCVPQRPGIPDKARPEIALHRSGGGITTVAKWEDDRHPDFDAIYIHLLTLAETDQHRKPTWEGEYAPDWRPE